VGGMNAMNAGASFPVIPENAPFSSAQRSWLNGFLAGLYGAGQATAGMSMAEPAVEEDFPWHDPALEMEERLQLAEGRQFDRRLMAAMAQLDCGQCGYLCQTYAEALASGRESSASLCVPGAKPTSKMLKQMLAERPADEVPVASAPVSSVVPAPLTGMPVRVLEASSLTGAGSAKDVRHIKIDLSPSGLVYEPGGGRRGRARIGSVPGRDHAADSGGYGDAGRHSAAIGSHDAAAEHVGERPEGGRSAAAAG